MKPVAERTLLTLAPPLGYAYIRLLRATMKLSARGVESVERAREGSGKVILAFWHSRFLMMPFGYPGERVTVLASLHRDAEILVRILSRFGFDVTRGSSTTGGVTAMRDLLRKAESGFDIAIAPDGPRGPRRRIKPGLIAAARLTGLPIVPMAFSAFPASRLGSWDRTLLPRPFSRGLFLYGDPIRVERRGGDAEADRASADVERAIDRITDEADRATGLAPEEPR